MNNLLCKVVETLELKRKENIIVYSDTIPEMTSLTPIVPANLVKPAPTPAFEEGRVDLFETLSNVSPEPDPSKCTIL